MKDSDRPWLVPLGGQRFAKVSVGGNSSVTEKSEQPCVLLRFVLKELNSITIMKANSSFNRWRTATALLIPVLIVLSCGISLTANSSFAQTCGWNIVSSPNTTSPTNFLSDVSVVAANDIWAVGGSASGSRVANPLTEHWDGAAWTIVPAPQPPGTVVSLGAVSAFSSTDVWAVGSSAIGNGPLKTFTEHWDGTQWSVVPSPSLGKIGPYPADNSLADVVAIASNDVWAVGSATTIVAGEALILHWDGSSWKIVPNPGANPRFYDANLLGITAVSANDIWAVGQSTTSIEHSMIEHWDGTKWSLVRSPAFPTNVDFMECVSAISATDIWAVGSFTIPNPEGSPYQNAIIHWDGTKWSVVTSPQPDDWLNILTSVTAISTNDVWAVGLIGTGSGYEAPETLHWDGASWSVVSVPGGSQSTELLGVAAVSSNDVWTVGETASAKKTLIERFTCE